MIVKCKNSRCSHAAQDGMYGIGIRVHTEAQGESARAGRMDLTCTVCGTGRGNPNKPAPVLPAIGKKDVESDAS